MCAGLWCWELWSALPWERLSVERGRWAAGNPSGFCPHHCTSDCKHGPAASRRCFATALLSSPDFSALQKAFAASEEVTPPTLSPVFLSVSLCLTCLHYHPDFSSFLLICRCLRVIGSGCCAGLEAVSVTAQLCWIGGGLTVLHYFTPGWEMGGKCGWCILGQTLFFPITRQEGASVVLHSLWVQRRLSPEFQLLCPWAGFNLETINKLLFN